MSVVKDIALRLKTKLKEMDRTPAYIVGKGVHKSKVYTVLQIGTMARDSYTISTLEEILEVLNMDLKELMNYNPDIITMAKKEKAKFDAALDEEDIDEDLMNKLDQEEELM